MIANVVSGEFLHGDSVCTDTAGFKDAYGNCSEYGANGWCTRSGTTGVNWGATWGALDTKVVAACCACGKGKGARHSHREQGSCYLCLETSAQFVVPAART